MDWMTKSARTGVAPSANESANQRHLHGVRHAGLILALFVLVFSGISLGQSLGDAAREARAKSQQNGTAPAKVITNDDLVEKESAQPEEETANGAQPDSGTQPAGKTNAPGTGDQAQNGAGQKQGTEAPAQPDPDAVAKDIKTRAATLRTQIAATQSQIAKLQKGYINRWVRPDSIPSSEYALRDQRAIAFNQQVTELIAEQKKLLADLKTQMETLKEEARHAGVKLPAK